MAKQLYDYWFVQFDFPMQHVDIIDNQKFIF